MKKILLTTLLFLVAFVTQAQIIINEVEADAGNNDGNGGEWIELKNVGTLAADLSCWRISNGLTNISIPNGLVLNVGEYLLIGDGSKIMCANCDYHNLNSVFNLNPDGFGPGTGAYSSTVFLNTDVAANGGCDCMTGTGALNNGTGVGDRVVLFNDLGTVVDAFMYSGGSSYGAAALTVNFSATSTCAPLTGAIIPATTDAVYAGRTICNDLGFCNSSYARLPDGNNGTNVTWSQTGNLACTNCTAPCGSATNSASEDNPTPGLTNSTNTWSATLNGNPVTATTTTLTVCGATPVTFQYLVNNFTNVALTATQSTGNLGSYTRTNTGGQVSFTTANFNSTSGITTLSSTFTPNTGTTNYEFVWGDANTICTGCPGATSNTLPNNITSTVKECYVYRKVTVVREDPLGGTPTASCSLLGSITIAGATGTNLKYELQKQTTTGGPFTTIAGPQNSNSFSGVVDDDADPTLPNYQVLVSSVNTTCANPTPLVAAVPITCLGNPVCATYATVGAGIPTFTPAAGSTVCANSAVQFSVDINGVCTNGQVEVLYDYNNTFDPYTSGTSLGLFNTTVGATPATTTATGKVFINEFAPRPQQGACAGTPNGSNPNSGEWIELHNAGTSAVDIGGWSISDGDWSATIPAGTTILANGYYLIGGGGTLCSVGALPDLNVETCNCATVSPASSDIMNLTDGNEQIALFDCSGTMIDGVLWGGGQSLPDATANTAPATGCGNYITQKSLSLPAVASFTSSGGSLSGGTNIGRYRTSTNTWTTITTALNNYSPKAANPGGDWDGSTLSFGSQCPPPAVNSSFSVTLPDTCSQAGSTNITLKAIYRPDPVAPCSKSDVTATATYSIPLCSMLTISGDGEYCAPNTAPISISANPALIGNHDITVGNGTNTTSINAVTGVGPFTSSVSNTGLWTITNVVPPVGTCKPHSTGSANIIIHPIPTITSVPTTAEVCNNFGFDLTNLNAQLVVSPIGSANTFIWYDQATGGSPIFPYVFPSGPTTYYVSASSGYPSDCEGPRVAVNLGITPTPDFPTIACVGNTLTLTPPSPNCLPVACSGIEYSANGLNWSNATSYTAADPGWAGFGSATNSTVYMRNLNSPSCFNYATYFNPCTYPLPTTLINFHGKLNSATSALLNWETAQEINASHFEIEKSNDKNVFTKIGKVDAMGNSQTKNDYEFIDTKLYNGENYYRLKIVDQDGRYVYSNVIVVIAEKTPTQIVSLYPNPANEFINVELNVAEKEKTTIEVIDMLGKKLVEMPTELSVGKMTIKVSTNHLAAGNYYIRMKSKNNFITKKFSKD